MAFTELILPQLSDRFYELADHPDVQIELLHKAQIEGQDLKSERDFYKSESKRLQHNVENLNELKLRSRVLSFPDSITRAEIKSPNDTWSFLCFGRLPKYSKIIEFRPGHDYTRIVKLKDFHRNSVDRLIISELPSTLKNKIHIFVDTSSPVRRYRLSTKETPSPADFSSGPHWTIHLKRLSWYARAKIWTGSLAWIYIVVPDKSNSVTSD